ncbi:YggS family pyridoxal phosphate-dependent enzyme, partial [bacterium]|nr:YggS family pyridoxal phosphate-dependent enzyme [bacterium]
IKYYELGFRDFGENRAKEAVEKINKLPDEILENSRFHLIGHLQTNKVKFAVGNFDLIHSVDSFKLALAISEEAKSKGITQKILLQINNAREEQKSGFLPEEIKEEFKKIQKLENIKICGVMNMAPINSSEEELHKLFGNIKQINDELQSEFGVELKQISMGMSNDYKIALEEGATIIRLGRILFE